MESKSRIKSIRDYFSLSMGAFGKKIGLSASGVSALEYGTRSISEKHIKLICAAFPSISETWLRTGNGEMFVSRTRDEEISEFIGDILRAEDDDFKKRLISQLAALDDSGWETLERFLDLIQHSKE